MNWQPIETAPKDGGWVLITGGNPDNEWYGTNDYPPCVVAKLGREDRWLFCDWDGALRSSYENPTHWMPLPDPPK